MTQFTIGSQQAGTITNVGGDATIGSQHGVNVGVQARAAVRDLRRALEGAAVTDADRPAVDEALDDLEDEVRAGTPETAASGLERLVSLLDSAGALAGAGAGLVGPITRLAGALGAAGKRVLPLLPW